MSRYGWSPYVPVAVRRARALKKMEKLRKKGIDVKPVEIEGRRIARTFWGEAWCDHLESFSDYENRLPRGRTYVRNGSVCHLDVAEGEVSAMARVAAELSLDRRSSGRAVVSRRFNGGRLSARRFVGSDPLCHPA